MASAARHALPVLTVHQSCISYMLLCCLAPSYCFVCRKSAPQPALPNPQAVGDEPVVSAAMLFRGSLTSNSGKHGGGPGGAGLDPLKEALERFRSFEVSEGARGGAEALFVLQVRLLPGDQGRAGTHVPCGCCACGVKLHMVQFWGAGCCVHEVVWGAVERCVLQCSAVGLLGIPWVPLASDMPKPFAWFLVHCLGRQL